MLTQTVIQQNIKSKKVLKWVNDMVTYLSTGKCRCNGVEMLKVRKKIKFDLNSWVYISFAQSLAFEL